MLASLQAVQADDMQAAMMQQQVQQAYQQQPVGIQPPPPPRVEMAGYVMPQAAHPTAQYVPFDEKTMIAPGDQVWGWY